MSYKRRLTREVKVGDIPLGGTQPIRIQSMTTLDTMDTEGSVEQTLRMVESGCEYVRLTVPSVKEAQNLKSIRDELLNRGCTVPLVADVHFTPNAAELSAKIIEKVRINPGNYADKKRFEVINYSDEAYEEELLRIKEKFTPLVQICKEKSTAMRIGTNHGSLSDRIMSRYGDTPLGMVESALEFIRICEEMDYFDIVISMKSSNPQVMVQAYRLLVQKLNDEKLQPYPLHLGVTEAGEAEDGRIKSALGIGTLLEEGLGDTVRVSLTEEPEVEAPVARLLIDRHLYRSPIESIEGTQMNSRNLFEYRKRESHEVGNFGYNHVPRVIADVSNFQITNRKELQPIGHTYLPELDKWGKNDMAADYVYSGDSPVPFNLPNGLKEIVNYAIWKDSQDVDNSFPLLNADEILVVDKLHPELNFLMLNTSQKSLISNLSGFENLVILLETNEEFVLSAMRSFFAELINKGSKIPVVVLSQGFDQLNREQLMLNSATDIGGLLIDGLGDGAMLTTKKSTDLKFYNQTIFGILQAARMRITKTEYISCPSCGRTLFDLQETTALIRKRTEHLKGVKIGIMGCVVNGPGEMADADFGYVGSGKDRITLYKGQDVIKRGVKAEDALEELLELIRKSGRWVDA